MTWESLMVEFAPYIFALIGFVISYTLYHFFSDSDLRIFLLLNSIIQFIIGGATVNGISILIAVLSLIPLVLLRKGGDSTE